MFGLGIEVTWIERGVAARSKIRLGTSSSPDVACLSFGGPGDPTQDRTDRTRLMMMMIS